MSNTFVVTAGYSCVESGPRNRPRQEALVGNSCDLPSLAEETNSWRLAACLRLVDALKYKPAQSRPVTFLCRRVKTPEQYDETWEQNDLN